MRTAPTLRGRIGVGHTRGVTPAIDELVAVGVEFSTHEYEHGGLSHDVGLDAAHALDLDPDQVFKTLLTTVDGALTVAIVPVSGKLSLKALGAARGAKRAEMADPGVAERVTGYVRGGISPFGQKKRLPTVLDRSANVFDTIYVSGGRRGLDVGVAPADLVRLLDAVLADITA